jgi:hypothetical protein
MAATSTESKTQNVFNSQHTQRIAFGDVNTPGSYVCNESGCLFRVPEDGLVSGRSPLIEIVSRTPTMMTKISDDPWLPISKARQLAADADLYINF